MSTLQERINEALRNSKMNASELAAKVNVSRATVSLWVNGPTNNLDGDNLIKAASVLGVDPRWLAGESGKMTAEEDHGIYLTGEETTILLKFRSLDKRDKMFILTMLDSLTASRNKHSSETSHGNDKM